MSIREIVNILTLAGIEENEANTEVKLLIEKFCNLSAVDIVMGKKLDESKLNELQDWEIVEEIGRELANQFSTFSVTDILWVKNLK